MVSSNMLQETILRVAIHFIKSYLIYNGIALNVYKMILPRVFNTRTYLKSLNHTIMTVTESSCALVVRTSFSGAYLEVICTMYVTAG